MPRGRAGASCSWKMARGTSLPPQPEANAVRLASEFRIPIFRNVRFRLLFHRRPALAAVGLQHAIGLRGLRHRVSPARAAVVQLQQPAGGVPECEGFGNVIGMDMDLVVPDASKSIADGAIAPWNTPAYAHELEELLALAADYDLPVDVPFSKLTAAAAGTDRARGAGAEVWRAGGFFRLAGAAEVQDAHPRVSQPLAELPALPGLRRHAAAARGPGGPRRRPQHRRTSRR